MATRLTYAFPPDGLARSRDPLATLVSGSGRKLAETGNETGYAAKVKGPIFLVNFTSLKLCFVFSAVSTARSIDASDKNT